VANLNRDGGTGQLYSNGIRSRRIGDGSKKQHKPHIPEAVLQIDDAGNDFRGGCVDGNGAENTRRARASACVREDYHGRRGSL
jgi:hypothetical protein